MNESVLFVDDDVDMCELITELLGAQGAKVTTASDLAEATNLLEGAGFDVVITDLELGNASGLDVCERVRSTQPDVPVIVLTGHGSMAAAVDAIRAGAYDFITKPVDAAALTLAVERAAEHRRMHVEVRQLRDRLEATENPGELVGQSALMKRVYTLIQRVKDTPASVLISGESGTGKELVARALHQGTPRADKPFVAINCAAVPATLPYARSSPSRIWCIARRRCSNPS